MRRHALRGGFGRRRQDRRRLGELWRWWRGNRYRLHLPDGGRRGRRLAWRTRRRFEHGGLAGGFGGLGRRGLRCRRRVGCRRFGCRRRDRGSGLLRRCLEDHRHGAGHARRERAKRRRRGIFFRRHGLRRGVRRGGNRIEYRGEPLLQFAGIGRGDEGSARDAGKAGERLELIGLAAVTDHMDAQRLRLLLHRRGRRADVGVARVAAVGDEDNVEALIFDLSLGGVAQGGSDRRLSLRLDLVEQLVLAGEGQLAGLGQSLAVGAVRCLAMAESHQPERQPARISAERGAELRLRGGDLGRIADLGVHAARRIEHDDGGGQAGDGRGRILGCGRRRPKQSGGQKHGAKPRAAFPPHGDSSDNPAASCYTRFRCATMG